MSLLSPGFKSIAEMAGWDEEALLLAIVEDTPIRDAKKMKRSDNLNINSPHSSSRTKRRAKRRNPGSISISAFNLDDEDSVNNNDKGNDKKVECVKSDSKQKVETDQGKSDEGTSAASSSSTALPCMDRLREELSCAICLEICFEPSTTPCGHSFCKKCLRSAADRCGKRCPKCRQFISNGRSCTVNTVLWNTIQLLFPGEVEARKAAGALNSREAESRSPEKTSQPNNNVHLTRRLRPVVTRRNDISMRSRADDTDMSRIEDGSRNRGRGVVSTQDEDAALALRLQREEVMRIYRGSNLARDNLRAMAQRAVNLRVRYRAV